MSNPTFNIANPIYIVNRSSDVDSRYGPWSSISDANNNVNINLRQIGLTVGVSAVGLGVTEYWYKNGTQDSDLILKTTGGGGGGTIELPLSANWNSVYSNVNGTSANWNSVYSNVNQNSALWNGFNTYATNFSVSGTNGALILNTSANNVFFRAVNTGQLFSYTNFTTGKTIIVYLSAAHVGEIIHQFPIGTYFNGVGDSNYVLTYEGKITKATISNIQNNFVGFAEIIQTQYQDQTIPRNIFDDNIVLDGSIGFLLQENAGRLIRDDALITPPLQICVQGSNTGANGTYTYSGIWTTGRPYYSKTGGYVIQWVDMFGTGNFMWVVFDTGNSIIYFSTSNTYLPTDASWNGGATVSVGAC